MGRMLATLGLAHLVAFGQATTWSFRTATRAPQDASLAGLYLPRMASAVHVQGNGQQGEEEQGGGEPLRSSKGLGAEMALVGFRLCI